MRLHSADAASARSLCGVGAAVLLASLAWAQTSPDGHWEGTLKGDRGDIVVSLDLTTNAKSQWIASMGIPPDMKGLVVTDIAVDGKSVKFTAAEMMMTRFELALEDGGILKGTYATRRGILPVEFRRTGKPNVELIPASPAVSKELEGDWEGALQMPNRTVRIIFHFKNQTDNTVAATIDTPDSKAIGLPLNDVKQSGQKVEFGIRVAHAGFEGTLNQDGTELAGQFKHGTEGVPLTLRKK